MLQSLPGQFERQVLAGPRHQRVGPIVLTVAVGVAYFLAARLSLPLLTMSGVAVFWPAAGVSSGILIALGRDARWPVAVGVIAANTAANLMGDRSVWSSGIFSLSDAGEALFVAWLIERYISSDFDLGKLRHVLGLLAATVVGTAASGIGGTLGFKLAYSENQPALITWQQWVASDSLGIIAVAPLIIGLVATLRAPPSRRELGEGAAALIAVAAATGTIVFMLPAGWWQMCVAVVLLFPVILCVAARCRPAVAAAAVFIVSLIVITTVTLKLGNYGLDAPSMDDSIVSAQITIAGTALCALVLSALFAERRQQEAVLVQRETRLQEALAAGSVLTFDWDVATDLVHRSDNAARILGLDPEQASNGKTFLSQVHPEDLPRLNALWGTLNRDNPKYATEYRFLRPDGREIWLQERCQAEFDDAGRLLRVTGLARDITRRKRSEGRQERLVAELDHRVKNILAQVAVVAASSRRDSRSIDEFLSSLDGRLQSMATAHTLLSESRWQSVGLDALVRDQLAPYATGANVRISGTDVLLNAAETQAVARVLHELATNAAKYGALSIPGGLVSVKWDLKPNGAMTSLTLVWGELGGPPVASAHPSSYGTNLICDLIPHELGGTVDLAFAKGGVNCRIEFPIRQA